MAFRDDSGRAFTFSGSVRRGWSRYETWLDSERVVELPITARKGASLELGRPSTAFLLRSRRWPISSQLLRIKHRIGKAPLRLWRNVARMRMPMARISVCSMLAAQ